MNLETLKSRPTALRLVTGLGLAAGLGVLAQVGVAAADPPHPPQPPPEAFTACDGKARGDSCSVTLHDHTVSGVCDAPPSEARLACRPNHPPPPPSGR